MSKTIIYSILGVGVIAVAAISVNSLELSSTDLDFANLLGQGQTVEDNQLVEANNSGIKSENVKGIDTNLFNQNKINALDNQRNRESDKKRGLEEKLNAKVKDLQFRKANKRPNQPDINNKFADSSVALSTNTVPEELTAGNQDSATANLNPAGVVGIVDGTDSNTSADGGDTSDGNDTADGSDTTDGDNTDGSNTPNEDDVDDGLAGRWRGRLEANLGEGCAGGNIDISMFKSGAPGQFTLLGTVVTDLGHFNINKRIPYSIEGSVTESGALKANLGELIEGFGVRRYVINFSGTLSEIQGSGTWSDDRNCSGSWTLSKV